MARSAVPSNENVNHEDQNEIILKEPWNLFDITRKCTEKTVEETECRSLNTISVSPQQKCDMRFHVLFGTCV